MQPMTLGFVYVGTTIKDIADISHGGAHFTRARIVSIFIPSGLSNEKLLLYAHAEVGELERPGSFIRTAHDTRILTHIFLSSFVLQIMLGVGLLATSKSLMDQHLEFLYRVKKI